MPLTIVLVGRPNVGKSTLFNRLTKSRNALVADEPGVTRDRQYGIGRLGVPKSCEAYYVIDSGGITGETKGLAPLLEYQVMQATAEAEVILFLVDGKEGLTITDENIAKRLREFSDKIKLVVNKTEGMEITNALADFYRLGFGEPLAIAAAHNQGIEELIAKILAQHPLDKLPDIESSKHTKVAVIGRPNVGKSTLINRLLGEDRLLALDMPGTTRDAIEVEFTTNNKNYILVDTAGIRRKGKIKTTVEKFSVIKAMQAVNQSQVVILVIDAREGFTDQDSGLLSLVLGAGKPLVIAMNKWDGMEPYQHQITKSELERRLHFVDYIPIHFISALHGSGIKDMFSAADKVYKTSLRRISTNKLTKALEQTVKKHPPPLIHGHRIKLRYAHQGGQNPPLIIIHGNQTEKIDKAYKRYLENFFRQEFKLYGTPLKLEFKSTSNPYKDKKNKLSKRQIAKKRRLKKFVRRKN